MSRTNVIHLRSLDTMGLRDVARAIGTGHAGVRLTPEGLALYKRRTRRGSAPAPEAPSRQPIATEPPLLHALPPASPESPRLPVASSLEPDPIEEPQAIGLRRPMFWAVILLSIGITFGTAIARGLVRHASARVAVATATRANGAGEGATVWPRATQIDGPPVASSAALTSTDGSAAAPMSPTSSATLPAARPSRHHHLHPTAPPADDEAPPPEAAAAVASAPAPADPDDAENGAAEIARARATLDDAL